MAKTAIETKTDASVEEKLKALYNLQLIDSQIDKIRSVRGELPLEVQDLEDEMEGLQTRLDRLEEELKAAEKEISDRKQAIKDAQALIRKYEEQQNKVRNNREYESISKEIEFQNLEIQISEKKIKELRASIANKQEIIEASKTQLEERKKDLEAKKKELKEILDETLIEEEELTKKSLKAQKLIDERLLTAYNRLRGNARNGLAVVAVERDACGGCFNHVPPQRQLDIRTHKKIIVCEHCGRILVDKSIITQNN